MRARLTIDDALFVEPLMHDRQSGSAIQIEYDIGVAGEDRARNPPTYAGRFGEWGYHWTDEVFKSGEQGAAKVIQRLGA
jgi:hypothetical protein